MRADAVRRVVIDTNVWISAFLTRSGTTAVAVRELLGMATPVFTDATFTELHDRLWLPKFDRYLSMDMRRVLLHDAHALAYWTEVSADLAARSFCRDPDDDKFLHAASASGAVWLVTGDRDLLDLVSVPNLQILAPSDVVRRLLPGTSDTS